MSANHLEQLVCEWYEFQGYFVRRNVLAGRRSAGGHETELDVVAFHPEKHLLVHIEPSLDANSWAEREARYAKKFAAGRKFIPSLFPNLSIPKEIDQVALFLYGSGTTHPTIGGGRVVLVAKLIRDIMEAMLARNIKSSMVPEQYPLLRTLMFASEYRNDLMSLWKAD